MQFASRLKIAAQLLPCYLLAMALGAEGNIPFLNPLLSQNSIRKTKNKQTKK